MNWNKYSLFKLPGKHKRFEYTPRYYDPRKEELNKKIRQAKREAGQETGEGIGLKREISFREEASDRWGNSAYKSKNMSANLRLIIILGVALIGFYFLFQSLDDVGLWLDSNKGN